MRGAPALIAASGRAVDLSRHPAPVRALVAAGRASLGHTPVAPVTLTDSESAELADFAIHHGMVAWLSDARAIASAPPRAGDVDILRRHLGRVVYGIRDLTE